MSPLHSSGDLALGISLQQGKYRLDEHLGQSGAIVSYRATHRGLNQSVLIQTLQGQSGLQHSRSNDVQRFVAIAQQAAKVHHPNLVHINDLFVELDLPFMVTEHIPGESLGNMATRKPFEEETALEYIGQLGAGLTALHEHHCLHGSLNPCTLVLRKQQVLLTSLGLERELTSGSPRITLEGYLSPKQLIKQELTPADDVYAIAAVLYTLLTGKRPISSALRPQNSLVSPRQLCPHLSTKTEQAILSGMALNLSDRPSTLDQWLSLLSPPSANPSVHPKVQVTSRINAPVEEGNPQITPQSATKSDSPSSVPQNTMSVPAKRSAPSPRFPVRALLLSGGIAGVLGLGFGFVLRFHNLNQFSTPQVSSRKNPKIQRESFPPRPQSETLGRSLRDNPTEKLPTQSSPSDNFAGLDPIQSSDEISKSEETQQVLTSEQTNRSDLIIESEIGEIPRELTPAKITVAPDSAAVTSNDWADVLPQNNDLSSPAAEADLPSETQLPLPSELDEPDLSGDIDREFSVPQI